jgi:hypothetical protein
MLPLGQNKPEPGKWEAQIVSGKTGRGSEGCRSTMAAGFFTGRNRVIRKAAKTASEPICDN